MPYGMPGIDPRYRHPELVVFYWLRHRIPGARLEMVGVHLEFTNLDVRIANHDSMLDSMLNSMLDSMNINEHELMNIHEH